LSAEALKEARLALRALLAARGVNVAPGEEMRGLNRRQPNAALVALAQAVCRARALPPPTPDEIASAGQRAHALDVHRCNRWDVSVVRVGLEMELDDEMRKID
jgi:hypothetical protein